MDWKETAEEYLTRIRSLVGTDVEITVPNTKAYFELKMKRPDLNLIIKQK